MTSTTSQRQGFPSVSELYFKAGIPGFARAKAFDVRVGTASAAQFYLLESRDVDGLCFMAVTPSMFFPSYHPELEPEVYEFIGAGGPDDVELLVVITLGREGTTANLLGPLVINAVSGQAVQAVAAGFGSRTPIAGTGYLPFG